MAPRRFETRSGARSPRRRPRRRSRGGLAIALALAVVITLTLVLRPWLAAGDTAGATVRHATIAAPLIGGRARLALVSPAGGGRGRPLLVFLHGRGGDEDSELSGAFFRALRGVGRRAPDVVFPAGGDHSYWHDRASGRWGSYVIREVIPYAIAHLHADPHRIAIGGISMGGFGAYDLARRNPGRFCAVGGHSAALWPAAGDTAPGAFDDARDFARHDVIAAARADPRLYGHARLWLDGGASDPFHAADEQLASALRVRMRVWPGGHEQRYWDAHFGAYLRFYAGALAHCERESSHAALGDRVARRATARSARIRS